MSFDESAVADAEWTAARAGTKRSTYLTAVLGLLLLGVLAGLAAYLATLTTSGDARYLLTTAVLGVLGMPVVAVLARRLIREQQQSDEVVARLARELTAAAEIADKEAGEREVQARRQKFESRLANALDMAEGEPEVIEVIERSFASAFPDAPVELLLADNSHAHLLRMATSSPTGAPPGCGVDSPDHCPAARRAQVQRFSDSEELDACPKLRGRPDGAISALCVPVSIMGRTVGVIHATAQRHRSPAESSVQDLETLAKLAGARIGLLRVMAETRLQASTDNLTGLLNRRSFEERTSALRRDGTPMTVVMSDLDHFKTLNDTYGHETGDRALRLFAQALSDSVRAQDVVSRHGGEEFVLALPGCSAQEAHKILEGLKARLDAAISVAGLPRFTVSIGVVEAAPQEDLPAIIDRADAALFQAKRDGRDRIVIHDASGNPVAAPSEPTETRRLDPERTLSERNPLKVAAS